jgi:hypothetical protein
MSLLQSNASIIIENTVLLLHILTTHSPQTNIRIREVALNSGILLQHFYSAVFSSLEGQRFLSRHLCALWFSGPPDSAEKNLLKRMIPAGFLPYLAMPILSEAGKSFASYFVTHYCNKRQTLNFLKFVS